MALAVTNPRLLEALNRLAGGGDYRRVVIDIEVDHPVMVYVERFAEDPALGDVMDALLTHKPIEVKRD